VIHVALFEPEIPQNTGNIIRLCANTGAQLHLIEPLGFSMENSRLKRAGLDYHEWATVQRHADLTHFLQNFSAPRIYACTTKGKKSYTDFCFQENDILLFGPESRGLPALILEQFQETLLRIPMTANSRSLNLSNAVAVVVYEAWRQLGFK
jgi:tRNA (cytidine/uridine-2'-O-)-methyltransferase